VVVGAGVDDLVLAVVGEVVRGVRVRVEVVLQDRHPGVAEAVAQALDCRRDHAEVLRDQRQLAELGGRGVEDRAARAALPAPRQGVARALRHGPVGDEAAEVVDAGEVVEVERAPQALDPPAVAAPPQRRPVVERVAPQLALVGVCVGRRARHRVVAEDLRMRPVVDRAGRDIDRHIADQPHAALLGMRAQCRPLAVEPHLVGHRAAPSPLADPVRVALAEVQIRVLRHRRARVGKQSRPCRERRRGLVRRSVPIRRPERQHLPPRLARIGEPVDEPVRFATQPSTGQ
jgi:hypothetical protein